MDFITKILIKTFFETVYITGIIILMGLMLGILRDNSLRNFQRSFGRSIVMITGLIGVPIHEISHAILAFLFGHKIDKVKLLQRPDINGVMGYVTHRYNKNSIYQQVGNFFIGIAPIFGGSVSIIILMKFIIADTYNEFIQIIMKNINVNNISTDSIKEFALSYIDIIKYIFSIQNLKNPYFYLFLFIAICISSHIALSTADIKGASKGLGIIFIVLFILNLVGLNFDIVEFNIIKYNVLVVGILIVALILSFITYLISLFLVGIFKR